MDVQIVIPQDSGQNVMLTDGIMLDLTDGGAIDLRAGAQCQAPPLPRSFSI